MSYILGIDTSSIDMGVSLFEGATAVASYSRFIRNSHAEHIVKAVQMMLNANSVDPFSINHIAVTTGPGSFTGLRIGIAFVKGMCVGRENVKVLPVSSLKVLAYAGQRHSGRIIAAIDARNDAVFWASFKFVKGEIVRLSDDAMISGEAFRSTINESDIIISDTMGFTKSSIFDFLKEHPGCFPIESFSHHRGYYCALRGSLMLDNATVWKSFTEIHPEYLRDSSATQRLQG